MVPGFTFVNNATYALTEYKATSPSAALDDGQIDTAMESLNGAITLTPDVGTHHVIRANILDEARNAIVGASDQQSRLALEACLANGRAVQANPFAMYIRLNFAESALTLASLGLASKDEGAIEEYLRLTTMQPRFWLSHFLLGRAYVETGKPG